MASFAKWLGASLGWSFGGPIGGILGFVVGTFIDGFSEADIKGYQQRIPQGNARTTTTRSGDFEVSLLILASVVIKADGNIDRRELDFVRQQFVNMFGATRANRAFKLFKGIIKKMTFLHGKFAFKYANIWIMLHVCNSCIFCLVSLRRMVWLMR